MMQFLRGLGLDEGSGTLYDVTADKPLLNGLSANVVAALQAAASGAARTFSYDGSGRTAQVTNTVSGRSLTYAYADTTHLTISDNRTPQAVCTVVLDGAGRPVSLSGNFS